jgi:hypothetical protein
MLKAVTLLASLAGSLICVAAASAGGWTSSVTFTNQVASTPFTGGGYPVPTGATAPLPGTCRTGVFNSNQSESWLAVKPGTEDLVASSKFFFENFSSFYNFYLGAYQILDGVPSGDNQVQGYDCTTVGTQAMPPSWMNVTDPNVDFDTRGRVYQVTLPFNPFWVKGLHPDGEIDISYSDDMGRHWVKGNGGQPLEPSNNASATQFGHVEDKQWVAVNHIVGNRYQDHVYAGWTVYNGSTAKIRIAVSRDRGQTFTTTTLSAPSQTGPYNEYVYPSIDAAGNVYAVYHGGGGDLWVTRSTDDGVTWSPFVLAAQTALIPSLTLPNTTFRDGIVESFAASPTYAGHLYLTYEDWTGTNMDVKFTQSIDGGQSWSTPITVNDNVDSVLLATDQFQPSVAAGPNGAVAIAFYDRRLPCPTDQTILPADQGRSNFCINTSLQAYKDSGSGAVPLGGNVRISKYSWDPQQPGQTVGGLPQLPCADADCSSASFIGDYFGLAISRGNIYALSVSTHYPSTSVRADNGGRVYYQQQVLATVPRSDYGAGY